MSHSLAFPMSKGTISKDMLVPKKLFFFSSEECDLFGFKTNEISPCKFANQKIY